MPAKAHDFAIGIDGPFYLSLHSRSAKLGPQGSAVVHVAKYLPVGEGPARNAIEELEARVAELLHNVGRGRVVARIRAERVEHALDQGQRDHVAVRDVRDLVAEHGLDLLDDLDESKRAPVIEAIESAIEEEE